MEGPFEIPRDHKSASDPCPRIYPGQDDTLGTDPRKIEMESQIFRSSMIVSTEAPYHILHAELKICSMLEYRPEEICGRSIKILYGPGTDVANLQAAIKSASLQQASSLQVNIYTKSGQSRVLMAHCSPHYDGIGSVNRCSITLDYSDAMTLQESLAKSQSARAILSVQSPHRIEMISAEFTNLFGFTPVQVIGRTLRLIYGPKTDPQRWNALYESARSGQVAQERLYTSSSSCREILTAVTCIPVVDQSSGAATHLLLQFFPLSAASEFSSAARSAPTPIGKCRLEQQSQAICDLNSSEMLWQAASPSGFPLQGNRMFIAPTSHFTADSGSAVSVQPNETSSATTSSFWPEQGRLPDPMEFSKMDQNDPSSIGGFSLLTNSGRSTGTADDSRDIHLKGRNSSAQLRQMTQSSNLSVRYNSSTGNKGDLLKSAQSLRNRDASSSIRPRRKMGDETGPPIPVTVTLGLLESLSHITLHDAAKQMGVSSTALKKACRKLGVQRWPYRPRTSTNAPDMSPICDFKESYVRKLHRKYGGPRRPQTMELNAVAGDSVSGDPEDLIERSGNMAMESSSSEANSGLVSISSQADAWEVPQQLQSRPQSNMFGGVEAMMKGAGEGQDRCVTDTSAWNVVDMPNPTNSSSHWDMSRGPYMQDTLSPSQTASRMWQPSFFSGTVSSAQGRPSRLGAERFEHSLSDGRDLPGLYASQLSITSGVGGGFESNGRSAMMHQLVTQRDNMEHAPCSELTAFPAQVDASPISTAQPRAWWSSPITDAPSDSRLTTAAMGRNLDDSGGCLQSELERRQDSSLKVFQRLASVAAEMAGDASLQSASSGTGKVGCSRGEWTQRSPDINQFCPNRPLEAYFDDLQSHQSCREPIKDRASDRDSASDPMGDAGANFGTKFGE